MNNSVIEMFSIFAKRKKNAKFIAIYRRETGSLLNSFSYVHKSKSDIN